MLLFLMFLFAFQTVLAKKTFTLAIHPYLSVSEIEKKFTPLVNYLSEQSGIKIILKIGSNYDEHIDFVATNKADIAYMGPASYVKLVTKASKKPILAKLEVDGKAYFQGVIIVQQDSNINTLLDLKNKRIALGNSSSTMSFIVPHFQFHHLGVFKKGFDQHSIVPTHDDIAMAVLSGDFDAGAVKPEVYERYKNDGLKILAKTQKISEHLFVTRSDLPKETFLKLQDIMLTMNNSLKGLKVLQHIKKKTTALVPAKDSDYSNLRQIILESNDIH